MASTTVILVRHAEKAAEPAADPPLTAAGARRAEALVELVKDAGVNAIYSTQFARTRQTAAPLAEKLGIPVEILDARAPSHPRMVADSVLSKHRGQTVLVVGHSNTVPAIVAALGAPQPAEICDADYDNVFVVTVPAVGAASVVRMHFGAPAGGVSCAAAKN
jgi:broad specificity phosphatase PhoE